MLASLFSLPTPDWSWIIIYPIFLVGMFSTYFIFFLTATAPLVKRFWEREGEDIYSILQSDSLPEISILVPAYNESKNIVTTVHTLLGLTYRYKQITIVNDGSTDDTLLLLIKEFSLYEIPPSKPGTIETAPIKAFYRSSKYPILMVIDKQNGGKADALNAGLNTCTTPAFIASDADTLIDDNALLYLVRPFLESKKTIVAQSSICIANGCTISENKIKKVGFPNQLIAGFQVIEYLRGFYLDRMGFNWTNGALIVPGAFGMFKTKYVLEIGGYDRTSLAEDMEIVMRLHQHMTNNKQEYHITYIPDPVAWTEAPETIEVLRKQRLRWYIGTTKCMKDYAVMCFNPKYKAIGMIVYPYYVIDKLISPTVELSGYIVAIIGLALGKLGFKIFLVYGVVCWAIATIISLMCIAVEEMTFRKYDSGKELIKMIKCCLLENLTYHYITLPWKLKGLIVPRRGKQKWHATERRGYTKIGK